MKNIYVTISCEYSDKKLLHPQRKYICDHSIFSLRMQQFFVGVFAGYGEGKNSGGF